MTLKFFTSNIYHRATTALSMLWLLLGTIIYISTFGSYNNWDEVSEGIPAFVSWWIFLCYKMGVTVFDGYRPEVNTHTLLESIFNNKTYIPNQFELSFNWLGYLIYITVPVFCIWALMYSYKWVVNVDIK